MDKIAVEILAVARMALKDEEKDSGPVEAYGVKGMKSTPWRKTFKSQADFDKWLAKNEGDVEVHGTRKASRVAIDFTNVVAPYEEVLKSMGFRPSAHNVKSVEHGAVWWIADLDPKKYGATRMSVVIGKDKVEMVADDMSPGIDIKNTLVARWDHPIRGYSPARLKGDLRSGLWEIERSSKTACQRLAAENPLDGMTNDQARRNVNQVLAHYTRGVFSDQSWEAVNRIWHALTAAQLDWTMVGNQYHTNDRGVPSAKTWKFEVKFLNKNGRPTMLYGTVTAAGAGSVEDPLDRYDLTAYVS